MPSLPSSTQASESPFDGAAAVEETTRHATYVILLMLTALTVLFAWTGDGGEALATGLAVGFEGIALMQRQNRFVSQQTARRLLQGILGALALLGFVHLYLGSWLEGGAILMGSIGEALRVPDVPNDERTNTPG